MEEEKLGWGTDKSWACLQGEELSPYQQQTKHMELPQKLGKSTWAPEQFLRVLAAVLNVPAPTPSLCHFSSPPPENSRMQRSHAGCRGKHPQLMSQPCAKGKMALYTFGMSVLHNVRMEASFILPSLSFPTVSTRAKWG